MYLSAGVPSTALYRTCSRPSGAPKTFPYIIIHTTVCFLSLHHSGLAPRPLKLQCSSTYTHSSGTEQVNAEKSIMVQQTAGGNAAFHKYVSLLQLLNVPDDMLM